ncbi:unnamed protein product [Darwinula stevensoni]|uniref:Uncharacterized protein n=1 Tax=Darwinula stevensoni TaxID=69355 RepID=A0A7R8X421_9CRUS|nr:unnamed protein product [Darwinula stevensoni]CAG0878629.1 unnamed protein product [Darwinula stevensoni]
MASTTMCAAMHNDSERKRFVDRIKAVTFHEVCDRCGLHSLLLGGCMLRKELKNIILEGSGYQKKSCTGLSKEIQLRRSLKPWHELAKPQMTALNVEDQLWFADFLSEWDQESFLHLAASDKFFVYVTRKPNSQNNRIWSKTPEDIPDEEHYQELLKTPNCMGTFVLFTARHLMWSWDSAYFWEEILSNRVIPFLKDPQNVLDIDQVTFLHDKALCMKALWTQQLLKDNNIDFFGNEEWLGNSPDFNVCEHIGSILKDQVERRMLAEPPVPDSAARQWSNTLKQEATQTIELMTEKRSSRTGFVWSSSLKLKECSPTTNNTSKISSDVDDQKLPQLKSLCKGSVMELMKMDPTLIGLLAGLLAVSGQISQTKVSDHDHPPLPERCEPIAIPLCTDIQYNMTIMPNLLGHQKQDDAGMDVHQYFPLVKVACSPDLQFFLCTVYAPVCTILDKPLPPCRSLCLSARNGCEELLNRFGFSWPDHLDCYKFPESGGSEICVPQNNSSSDKNRVQPTDFPRPDSGYTGYVPNSYYPSMYKPGEFPPKAKDYGFVCPIQFKTPEGYDEYVLKVKEKVEKNCGAPCEGMFFKKDQLKFSRFWIFGWSLCCLISCSFTILTFLIDMSRFRYPERPIIFLSICYFMVALTYVIGYALGDKVACNEPFDPPKGDIMAGVCFVGLWHVEALRGFVLTPLCIYFCLGTIFLLAGFVSLFRIRTIMKHDGTKTDKLEKLMIRIGVFSVLYLVPATIVLACLFYEQTHFDEWMVSWLHENCQKFAIPCPLLSQDDLARLARPDRSVFTVFMMKYLMTLIVGITSGFWIWSSKTLTSWSNFYAKLTRTCSSKTPKNRREAYGSYLCLFPGDLSCEKPVAVSESLSRSSQYQ